MPGRQRERRGGRVGREAFGAAEDELLGAAIFMYCLASEICGLFGRSDEASGVECVTEMGDGKTRWVHRGTDRKALPLIIWKEEVNRWRWGGGGQERK